MQPEWVLWTASHYHYRDIARFQDGSYGSFKITHEQFKRELEEAFRRGVEGDTSVPHSWPIEEWRRHQEMVTAPRPDKAQTTPAGPQTYPLTDPPEPQP